MVEKPAPEDAPSRKAVDCRYTLDPTIFIDLMRQTPGAGVEIKLTDVIAQGAPVPGLAGLAFSGQRCDCGSTVGMLRATLHLAGQDA